MKVIPPVKNIDKELAEKFLLEDNFELKFSLKQKIYYNFLRPVIPISLRQKIQHSYIEKISYKENFINTDFVELVSEALKQNNEQLYPDNFQSATILTHDVEEEAGFNFIPKVIELEKELGFKSSWNIVPYKYKIDESIIGLINNSGCEIGIHGYNHDGRLYYSQKIFNDRVPYINSAIEKYNAVGFRSPMVHRNLRWLQKLNIKYDASCFDYDPFQPFPGGTGSIWPFIVGNFVELPYTLPQDHTLFYVLDKKDITLWVNKINWIINQKGMILVLTHPDYLIDANHFQMYKELLLFLKEIKNSWYCLPKEMADWWIRRE
ncbi:MAG TPA: hypothetical protein VLN45_06105 [Ignavibacteriaceae bacterium]|nr:hypothetical protein [Ignavibacteriaceae bacterium]